MNDKSRGTQLADDRLDLEIARIDLVYRQNIVGTVALVVFVATYGAATWASVPHQFLIPWMTCLLASSLLRVLANEGWRRARRRLVSIDEASKWLRYIHGLLFVSGMGWGAIGLRLMFASTVDLQLLTLIMVLFMSAGAIVCYAASLSAVMLVMLPAMVGLNIGLLFSNQPQLMGLGGLTILYSLLGLASSRALSRYVGTSLKLNVENSLLARRLQQQVDTRMEAQAEVERSQAKLELALRCSKAFVWEWNPKTDNITSRGKTIPMDDFVKHFALEDGLCLRTNLLQTAESNKDLNGRIAHPHGRRNLKRRCLSR